MAIRHPILICDDDSLYHLALKSALKGSYDCRSAYNTDEALSIIRNHTVDALLLDVHMRTPEEGLDAIPKILDLDPELPIVMISGNVGFETVRKALTLGAIDYVPKDFNPEDLTHVLRRVLERKALARRNEQQNFEANSEQRKHILIGESGPIREVRRLIERFRGSPANVLIFGETGCGKEVVARQLRGRSPDGSLVPFVAVDSSTIQGSTAESTLFGHEKGAFTGAERMKKGVFEEADGGIAYFDEVANMPMDIQVKLLRAIQEKEVMRLGSTKAIRLDFRVICATNRDLDEMASKGLFKDDLLQRLNVLPIRIPTLRERAEDIPLLLNYFLSQSKHDICFSEDAVELLKKYSWPGNVRELMNVVAFTTTMADTKLIEIADLPPKLRDLSRPEAASSSATLAASRSASPSVSTPGFYEQVANFEKNLLAEAYATAAGNISKLALTLGMDRSHLYTKLKEYDLHPAKKSGS